MSLRFASLLSLAVAGALSAQAPARVSNAERIANDRYTRSHDYDLIHQKIEVSRFDWDSTTFDGHVATTLKALRHGLDSIVLDAGKLLEIRRVTARSALLTFTRHGDTLVVRLAHQAAFGDTIRFSIDYRGKVENGRGLTFKKAEAGHVHHPQQIWSQGQVENNHLWFPTYDFPNDKMTWELTATVPAMYTVVSNGRLVSDTRSGAMRTMAWSQERPTATYLVSIVVGQLVKIADSWRGIPVDYYVYREDSALARPLFGVTPDMIDTYSHLTGIRYPWAKYAQTTVADFFGGMENVSATTLVDWLPDARSYQDRPWYQYNLIPHELAHQWFGDYVTTENWANEWLNEGFAEFMPGQYWNTKLGRQAEDDYYFDEYQGFIGLDTQRRMPVAALGSNNVYQRGALILRMLKKQLGEQPFWASINHYLTTHALDNAVTDDFRQSVLAATGQNLDWFWDQWVYQAGYPEFTVTQSFDARAHRVTLIVRQTQSDTATADSSGLRFSTPTVFRMPLTVRVGTAQGDVVGHGLLRSREDTIFVDRVQSEPTMVVFDDGNAILKHLTFEQPTTHLAVQLVRDPDLWNRKWVIDELSKRTTDSAAARALASAVRGADYSLTRAQAAGALAAFPAAVALPVLVSALRDTSASVRRGAVAAIGRLDDGGGVALSAVRDAWDHDASYRVRSAAIGALARLDTANRATIIRAGLSTPSYRAAIQNAALNALTLYPGALPAAELVPLLGGSRNVAFALGGMASKGDTRSMQILLRHLDDDREWVREWALQAVQYGVPAEMALTQLHNVRDNLRHTDTRAAVSKAMVEIKKKLTGQ